MMERIMITISPDLLSSLDDWARRLNRKRSQVVREAIREWLEQQRRQEFEALLAEGYQEMAGHVAPIAEEMLGAQAKAAEGVWEW
ncbi:MAG: ribbon-helix-helix protein, CopG family [Anaerolineae bacterium]